MLCDSAKTGEVPTVAIVIAVKHKIVLSRFAWQQVKLFNMMLLSGIYAVLALVIVNTTKSYHSLQEDSTFLG